MNYILVAFNSIRISRYEMRGIGVTMRALRKESGRSVDSNAISAEAKRDSDSE